jgi:hypothetical protein
MDTATRRLVPIPEARQTLGGIGHTTLYGLVSKGEIVKVNIGRRGFITADSLLAYMDRLVTSTVDGGQPKGAAITGEEVGRADDVSVLGVAGRAARAGDQPGG